MLHTIKYKFISNKKNVYNNFPKANNAQLFFDVTCSNNYNLSVFSQVSILCKWKES